MPIALPRLFRNDPPPPEPPAYDGLPVRRITVGTAESWVAVHVSGDLSAGRLPVLCVPGYIRNMSDYADFLPLLRRELGADWPIILVDLRGRGRSPRRRNADDYTTTLDARDLREVARALAIEGAVVIGQGHGGQVAMALAAEWPGFIRATALIDAGPAIAPESLVRLRSNMQAVAGLRGAGGLTVMLRRMLKADYPALSADDLDRLVGRIQTISPKGVAEPLFDPALIDRLKDLTYDDVFEPQWRYFDLLASAPLLLVRSERTDQLSPALLEQMLERRPDAAGLVIEQQGSPPLLNRIADVRPFATFVLEATA